MSLFFQSAFGRRTQGGLRQFRLIPLFLFAVFPLFASAGGTANGRNDNLDKAASAGRCLLMWNETWRGVPDMPGATDWDRRVASETGTLDAGGRLFASDGHSWPDCQGYRNWLDHSLDGVRTTHGVDTWIGWEHGWAASCSGDNRSVARDHARVRNAIARIQAGREARTRELFATCSPGTIVAAAMGTENQYSCIRDALKAADPIRANGWSSGLLKAATHCQILPWQWWRAAGHE